MRQVSRKEEKRRRAIPPYRHNMSGTPADRGATRQPEKWREPGTGPALKAIGKGE